MVRAAPNSRPPYPPFEDETAKARQRGPQWNDRRLRDSAKRVRS